MRLPKGIKIGAFNWRIVKDLHLGAGRGRFGEMRQGEQEIALGDPLTEERQGETLLHEIIEVINAENEFKLEHHIITSLAYQLHQVLRENRLAFFDELQEEKR